MTHFTLWCLGITRGETQTTEAERDCLARHATGRKRVAEIGVWHGVTTSRLRSVISPDGMLVAIDPFATGRLAFSPQRVIASRLVGRVRNGTVRWERRTGWETGRDYASRGEAPFDLVFIDGDHTYEGLSRDWESWSPLIGTRGVIALHDSRSTPRRPIDAAGSVRFTREVIAHDGRFETFDEVDSLTVVRRRLG